MRGLLRSIRLRRGQWVRVRSFAEIKATLDADGKLAGLPFMPEMLQYCGKTFRIARRVEKLFLDHFHYVGRMTRAVLLENVRCDGRSHGGCELGCLTLWKEEWLEPVRQGAPSSLPIVGPDEPPKLVTSRDGKYVCQATELVRATTRLPWWDLRQYLRDLIYGEVRLGQMLAMCWLAALNKLLWLFGRQPYGFVSGTRRQTAAERLDLRPGELVEVKSRAEIEATLDRFGKTRGLGFTSEMARFCGRRFRVAHRVERLLIEWTGELRRLSETVALESVICHGIAMRRCPRNCHHLWREIWLKRVAAPTEGRPQTDANDSGQLAILHNTAELARETVPGTGNAISCG
jgi:hypothetical protein